MHDKEQRYMENRMTDQKRAFSTPISAPAWKRWILYSPVARGTIFLLTMVLLTVAIYSAFRQMGWTAKEASQLHASLADLAVRALAPLLAYVLLVKLIERRPIAELASRKWVPGGLAGVVGGMLMVSTTIGILVLMDSYHVDGVRPAMNWLGALTLAGLGAAIGEEIMFRGVLFRIVEEGLGTWWALALSALLFGAIHLGNEGASLWTSLALAINAGVTLGLLYHVTRSLPVCIGFHAAWNFFEGPFFGTPVSGFKAEGWLVSNLSGPSWITGGEFGLDGSPVTLIVCSLISLGLVIVAMRRRSIVPCRSGADRAPDSVGSI